MAGGCGLTEQGIRCYMSACVAASTAIADAAAIIARGHADRVVVAGGYLVECDQFALFDAAACLLTMARCARSAPGGAGCSSAMAWALSS